MEKMCNKCNVAKPETEFYARNSVCKACKIARQKEWNAANPDAVLRAKENYSRKQSGQETLPASGVTEYTPIDGDHEFNVLYAAQAYDLVSEQLMDTLKIGITRTDLLARMRTLNSDGTAMPILITPQYAFDFSGCSVCAKTAETAFHAAISDKQIRGEWFTDNDNTLGSRLFKFCSAFGARNMTVETDYSKTQIEKRYLS